MKPDYNSIVAHQADLPIIKKVLQRVDTVSGVNKVDMEIGVDTQHRVWCKIIITGEKPDKLEDVVDALMVEEP